MKHPHLTQDELMQAATDDTQLSAQAREHLLNCAACKARRLTTAARLGAIKNLSSQISRQSTPWYRFKSGQSETSAGLPFGVKLMLIVIVLSALMFMLNSYGPFRKKTYQQTASEPVDISNPTSAFYAIDPLPEIYSELLSLWWRREIVAKSLDLTPEEIRKLEIAWKEALVTRKKLEKSLSDQQVELIIALEDRKWDEETVQRHFQRLSLDVAQSTNTRFGLLLNMRAVLGHERFQELLRLLK